MYLKIKKYLPIIAGVLSIIGCSDNTSAITYNATQSNNKIEANQTEKSETGKFIVFSRASFKK